MKIRPAKLSDSDILLSWRNDPVTRRASHNTRKVSKRKHIEWLKTVLRDPTRKLFIAEENGVPVGTVRVDLHGDTKELSWTVAHEHRGQGIGKRMVRLLSKKISSKIMAEVKIENRASHKIAIFAGMRPYSIIYQREKEKT